MRSAIADTGGNQKPGLGGHTGGGAVDPFQQFRQRLSGTYRETIHQNEAARYSYNKN